MTQEDLLDVERIFRAAAHRAPPEHWADVARRAIDKEGGPLAWVAAGAEGGAVRGYVFGEVRCWEFGSDPAGWITGIGVEVAHQGEGLGKRLLAAFQESLRARGVDTLRTMVQRDDVDVLRFFRGMGFAAGPYIEMELSGGGKG